MSLTAEWSHNIDAAALPDAGLTVTVEANPQESADLARRFGVTAIAGLRADIQVKRNAMVYRVAGRIHAAVTSPCVVTSTPVAQTIDESFEAFYADKTAAISLTLARHERQRSQDAEVPMLEESEDPEPLIDGQIDVGELASQYLALAIDPYPRAPGVAAAIDLPEAARPSPFEALKKL